MSRSKRFVGHIFISALSVAQEFVLSGPCLFLQEVVFLNWDHTVPYILPRLS